MQANDIKHLIEAGLINCTAFVEGDDGVHFSATVVSPAFTGKNRVQRQQIVYATLGNRIHDGTIHALSLKTLTPEEWQTQNG
ncbi:MAG: BolA family protein [uncultured bacterium]|nr:MAG: BolA family protein [uncultured bacterium]